jgi:hypothetical protein
MGLTATEAAAIVQRLAAKGLLIGDEWVPSGGAGTYAHHNPATGTVQADVALAARRLDRAAAAARFPCGRRSDDAADRDLHRLADLLDEHHAEGSDRARQRRRSRSSTPRTRPWVRYRRVDRQAHRRRRAGVRRRPPRPRATRAEWGGGGDPAVERAR